MKNTTLIRSFLPLTLAMAVALAAPLLAEDKTPPKTCEQCELVPTDSSHFSPDPQYSQTEYDAQEQLEIYGGKSAVKTVRPLLELGRRQYVEGPLSPSLDLFGRKNLMAPGFMIFGDMRVAGGYNDKDLGGTTSARAAAKLNLDFDLKLTATERFHALITPLDRRNVPTRYEFAVGDAPEARFVDELDPNVDTLFFEGDFGRILAGFTDRENAIDLPFSLGRVPLLAQNGIWLNDAFTGFAITPISARSTRSPIISNLDVTLFAANGGITVPGVAKSDRNLRMAGMFGFAEANRGYWEFGYAFVDSKVEGQSYHNATIAHSRRLANRVSNSVRLIANAGQKGVLDPVTNRRLKSANGFALLVENALITRDETSFVPYFNLFAGYDTPRPLALAAGNILINTGINFEADAITGFPRLDDSANNTVGGAIGVEHLFGVTQQLVVEGGFVKRIRGNEQVHIAQGDEFGIAIRYQIPISTAWIVRADAMRGFRENGDLSGFRIELRRKF